MGCQGFGDRDFRLVQPILRIQLVWNLCKKLVDLLHQAWASGVLDHAGSRTGLRTYQCLANLHML
jgi:hypothetical protein